MKRKVLWKSFFLFAIFIAYEIQTHPHPCIAQMNTANVYTPSPQSPERKAMMDAWRVKYNQDVVFVIKHLKVNGDWAWATAIPQSKDGRQKWEPQSALFHKDGSIWKLASTLDLSDEGVNEIYGQIRAKYPNAPPAIFDRNIASNSVAKPVLVAQQQPSKQTKDDTINVIVGNDCSCGNRGGEFDAVLNGNKIAIDLNFDPNSGVRIYQANNLIKEFDYVLCPSPGKSTNALSGKEVKIDGHWLKTGQFEAHSIHIDSSISIAKLVQDVQQQAPKPAEPFKTSQNNPPSTSPPSAQTKPLFTFNSGGSPSEQQALEFFKASTWAYRIQNKDILDRIDVPGSLVDKSLNYLIDNGWVRLDSFAKTNGALDSNIYTMYYQATITQLKSSINELDPKPGTYTQKGEIYFKKTENGWIPLNPW